MSAAESRATCCDQCGYPFSVERRTTCAEYDACLSDTAVRDAVLDCRGCVGVRPDPGPMKTPRRRAANRPFRSLAVGESFDAVPRRGQTLRQLQVSIASSYRYYRPKMFQAVCRGKRVVVTRLPDEIEGV